MNQGSPAPAPTKTASILAQAARRRCASCRRRSRGAARRPGCCTYSTSRRDDRLGQAELRDAVDQHAAGLVQRLEDGDVVPSAARSPATVSPAGPEPTTATRLAVGRRDRGQLARCPCSRLPVGEEALEAADGDGLALLARGRTLLALLLLRADPAADGRQGVRLLELRDARPRKSPSAISLTKPGMSIPTGQPSTHVGFLHGRQREASRLRRLARVAERHLVEVADALGRRPASASAAGRSLGLSSPPSSIGRVSRSRSSSQKWDVRSRCGAAALDLLGVVRLAPLEELVPVHLVRRRSRGRRRRRTSSCRPRSGGRRRTSPCRRS